MPTTVNLQPNFIGSAVPLLLLAILLISPLFIGKKERKKQDNNINSEESRQTLKPVPPDVRKSYVNLLEKLRQDYISNNKTSKECYQALSSYIRVFVLEYAGIDVRSNTLAEIRAKNLPALEQLIEEYYACEFSPDVTGDVERAIKNTVEVIYRW